MPHFFYKLIPPRPTFAKDMNDEERMLMHDHAAYLKDLQEKGVALAYGPVFDPKGSFGMAIFEAADEKTANEIANNDPTINAGLHTFEIYPMRAVVKGH